MDEANLIRYLARLGLDGVESVLRQGQQERFPRLYHALDQPEINVAGRDLAAAPGPLLVMGASSVAEAWLTTIPGPPHRSGGRDRHATARHDLDGPSRADAEEPCARSWY